MFSDHAEALAHLVEAHHNEFAEAVVSVGYSISVGRHHVLAVYIPVEVGEVRRAEAVGKRLLSQRLASGTADIAR